MIRTQQYGFQAFLICGQDVWEMPFDKPSADALWLAHDASSTFYPWGAGQRNGLY
jgi:hypothetical protein